SPDGIALGPEVFALVVEALGVAVEHHAQRHAVDAGADAAVVHWRARVDGHAVRLRRIADDVGAGIHHEFQQHALVEARAADQKIVGRPFAALVLAPGLPQPFAVGLEAAGGQYAGARLDALAGRHARGKEAAVLQVERHDGSVV